MKEEVLKEGFTNYYFITLGYKDCDIYYKIVFENKSSFDDWQITLGYLVMKYQE
jgi:hypothetical protein